MYLFNMKAVTVTNDSVFGINESPLANAYQRLVDG